MATEYAIIAGGCFWCMEAVFKQVNGVKSVENGYIGGHKENPTYKEVCNHNTGHAEAICMCFDPEKVSYGDLLDISFATHDPTLLNRQGNDIGTQYRSALFPINEAQHKEAKAAILRAQKNYKDLIVTTIENNATWWPAEDYHQNYWAHNGQENSYCLAVIPAKLQKLRKYFAAKVSMD